MSKKPTLTHLVDGLEFGYCLRQSDFRERLVFITSQMFESFIKPTPRVWEGRRGAHLLQRNGALYCFSNNRKIVSIFNKELEHRVKKLKYTRLDVLQPKIKKKSELAAHTFSRPWTPFLESPHYFSRPKTCFMLVLFAFKIKVSIILKMILWNDQVTKQKWPVCELGTAQLFNRVWFQNLSLEFGPEKVPGLSRNGPLDLGYNWRGVFIGGFTVSSVRLWDLQELVKQMWPCK